MTNNRRGNPFDILNRKIGPQPQGRIINPYAQSAKLKMTIEADLATGQASISNDSLTPVPLPMVCSILLHVIDSFMRQMSQADAMTIKTGSESNEVSTVGAAENNGEKDNSNDN